MESQDASKDDMEDLKLTVEVWKKTIDVQQHFNDIEMRIRNYAVTVLAAVIGASGLALRDDPIRTFSLFGNIYSVASWLIFAGLISWLAFYFMDRWWYHRLLQGAVKQAQKIESDYKSKVPSLNLSNAIRQASPFKIWKFPVGSDRKLDLFYGCIAAVLAIMMWFVR